jgi:LuxR family transcriptional regulator, maltose regulon positive regulatory protein
MTAESGQERCHCPVRDRSTTRVAAKERLPLEQRKNEQVLLTTKLIIPPPPLGPVISRERLHRLLDMGMQGTLTLLTAPAGFGKTTLLSHWLRQREILAAWVTLERSDNDLVYFWRYVITALDQFHPLIEEQVQDWLYGGVPFDIKALLTSVINALMALTHVGVLVLDDYQSITDPAIHSSLTFLLEHLPPQLHLVLTTRQEPPLSLARLRVRGQVTDVRTTQLRFTQEEVAAWFTERGLSLSTEALAALCKHTDGWVAGLYLAALALQERGEPTGLTHVNRTFIDIQQHVCTYLSEEVLAQLPEDVQAFVLKTSILSQLNASLCDAVTQQHTSAELLAWLEQAGLFLLPLDERGEWYRYQQLFREVLQHHLQQRQAACVPELHRRASLWYEEQGLPVEAVQHALAANEVERAANLIEREARPLPLQGKGLIEPLSEREQDVLMLMAAGLSNQEIAHKMVVMVSTVKTHLNNIYTKLGVHTRLQAVSRAHEIGLLKGLGYRAPVSLILK